MKHTLLATVAAATLLFTTGCTVSLTRFAIPVDTTALQLGVGTKLAPCDDAFTAVRIAPLWFGDDYVAGVNVSGISTSYANNGLAVGGILSAHEGNGLSAALVDHYDVYRGVRVGLFVWGGDHKGVQIGLFNSCSDASHALQIGLLNWAGEDETPRFLFNGSWGPNDEEE